MFLLFLNFGQLLAKNFSCYIMIATLVNLMATCVWFLEVFLIDEGVGIDQFHVGVVIVVHQTPNSFLGGCGIHGRPLATTLFELTFSIIDVQFHNANLSECWVSFASFPAVFYLQNVNAKKCALASLPVVVLEAAFFFSSTFLANDSR